MGWISIVRNKYYLRFITIRNESDNEITKTPAIEPLYLSGTFIDTICTKSITAHLDTLTIPFSCIVANTLYYLVYYFIGAYNVDKHPIFEQIVPNVETMDVLQAMRTFTAVVEAGSFVGAMNSTGLSKPAVSRHVAELEQHLGSRLIQRTTRRLSLTSEGLLYYQRCKEILAAVNNAEAEVGASAIEVQGELRVGAPQTFGALHLAALWGRFADQYPQVTLDVELSDKIVDVVEESYDLVVRIAQLSDSSLISRPLARTRMVLCSSPEYIAKKGGLRCPEDLIKHDIISYSYWSSGNAWSFSGPTGDITVHIRSRIQTNNGDTCRAAALDHQGIVLLPDFLVYEDLHSGRLIELIPDYKTIELGIYAIYPTRKQLPLKVRKLVDFLVDEFRNPVWK